MTETELDVELPEFAEGVDVEAKKAAGRDGRGCVPDDFFPTYSAMANTEGGVIYLGLKQRADRFFVHGVEDVPKVRKALWDAVNNREQISVNLLVREGDIQVVSFHGRSVLKVRVPRASRHQQPVHVGKNPIGGTFRRSFEGDYKCDDETVQRMLAERLSDTRDGRVLANFEMSDLEVETIGAYRNRFAAVNPDHIWVEYADRPFLESIGAWGRNREANEFGPTTAGLLMFGKWRSIVDAFPNYMLDYQERPEARAELRWIDRVVPDGTWSGNLYDFYRIVIGKLRRDLKVPFRLKDGVERVDEGPAHEALREALVNTLVHADYTGRLSVLVVKRPDLFGFRNPGGMRVPVAKAIQGGESDCRNRHLQTMFRLVGLGDQAGSGVPKVFERWKQQDYRQPELETRNEPEQTQLRLHLATLLPPDVVADLERRLGARFNGASALERIILVTAAVEGEVTHSRVNGITADHSTDITKVLSSLEQESLLRSTGVGRGKRYFLKDSEPGIDAFAGPGPAAKPSGVGPKPSGVSSGPSGVSSGSSEADSEPLNLDSDLGRELIELAEPVRARRKVAQAVMEETILALCANRWLLLKDLADLLQRNSDFLRRTYLTRMVEAGSLRYRYPNSPNHSRQAYSAPIAMSADD